MKKIRFALILFALSSGWLTLAKVSLAYGQDSSTTDVGIMPGDPSAISDGLAASITPKSAGLPDRRYRVGHFTKVLPLPGVHCALDPAGCAPGAVEIRSVDVHLWYPSLSSKDCNPDASSGISDAGGNGDDKGCSSVYTSRLYGLPLLPQWDALSWTIGSTQAFENLPISGARSFPIIIFSHGNDNNAIDYAYTLETLASFGFIVAAPDHVNNTQDEVLLDFINPKISSLGGTPVPCFDGLPSPCEVSNRYKKDFGKDPSLDCPQVAVMTPQLPTKSVRESMIDRVSDTSAIIDALPSWFGDRADLSRVGVMGHSRGTVTALAAAGGSTCWGFSAEPRVKAIMGLAIGGPNVTFAADVQKVTVPTLLVAGLLDRTAPASISQTAFNLLASTDKKLITMANAEHRHFDSALCAQTQSSGAIAAVNPTTAILDYRTVQTLVSTALTPTSGVATDFCGLDTFTSPSNIENLVQSLTGFDFSNNVPPTSGLSNDAVKDQVVNLAVAFFGRVLGAP